MVVVACFGLVVVVASVLMLSQPKLAKQFLSQPGVAVVTMIDGDIIDISEWEQNRKVLKLQALQAKLEKSLAKKK